MGIIDSKKRIFDTILTSEGRRQLSEGSLRARFYSFTDRSTFYKRDTIVSGGLDETYRFITEATNLPQDQISFEANDAGFIRATINSGSTAYSIYNGKIFANTGSTGNTLPQITGSAFASLSNNLLSGSIDAFKNQFILRSPDPLDDVRERHFNLSTNKFSYNITNEKPFSKDEISTANLKNVESFFEDARFSNVENYMFLPPVNKPRPGTDERALLGNYINLNQQEIQTYEELKETFLQKYIDYGYEQTIEFVDTSVGNNIISQFFEVSDDAIKKLDVIEFLFFEGEENIETNKHIFFVGKVFIDELGTSTFIHLFTVIFES